MFIRFTETNGTDVRLNPAHVVSIELPALLSGIQGGVQRMRIYATEGRVFTIEKKDYESIIEQIDCRELENGPNKDSSV